MIVYRPIAPLATGRTGLKSALAAMALTAVLGTAWQAAAPESSETPEITSKAAYTGEPS